MPKRPATKQKSDETMTVALNTEYSKKKKKVQQRAWRPKWDRIHIYFSLHLPHQRGLLKIDWLKRRHGTVESSYVDAELSVWRSMPVVPDYCDKAARKNTGMLPTETVRGAETGQRLASLVAG